MSGASQDSILLFYFFYNNDLTLCNSDYNADLFADNGNTSVIVSCIQFINE